MSVLGWVGKRITSPLRIAKNVFKGDFRGAVGEIGDNAKMAGVLAGATGVGLPVAAGLSAAGGVASKWGHGESNVGKIALAGVRGAGEGATAVGANKLFSGLPMIGGGPSLDPSGIEGGIADATHTADDYLASMAGAPMSPGRIPTPTTNINPLKSVGRFITKNPELVTNLAGTAVSAAGAAQQGGIEDQRLAMDKEELDRREAERQRQAKLDQFNALMQSYVGFRPRYN